MRQLVIPGITLSKLPDDRLSPTVRALRSLLHETANRLAKRLLPTDQPLEDPDLRRAIQATIVAVLRQSAESDGFWSDVGSPKA